MKYQKFYSWVDHRSFRMIQDSLREKGLSLPEESRIPCSSLRASVEIGFVAPPAWNGFCKRRTSWYWKSGRADHFLIIANRALSLPSIDSWNTVTESIFRPGQLPSFEEATQLIQSKKYQRKKPSEWDKPGPDEKDFYRRWFERYRPDEPFDFAKILLLHSANHANFIDPKFFVNSNGMNVPYSVGDSLHVCSSCLEFFNILGDQWSLKYVVPCSGAVTFAHLPMNQYLRVENHPQDLRA